MQAKSYRTQTGVLFDAGQELIGHTYVLVNDIRYGDKRSSREKKMSVAIGLGTVLSAAVPIIGQYAMAGVAALANDYSGFNVTVTSYLYRLKWDKEVENGFYQLYYTNPDVVKRQTFAKDKELFSLEYVGDYTVHSSNSNFKGINGREEQIRKVCTRAIDKAIAQLQKQHPQFRVRTPLFSVSPITAQIGLREDVDENSKYEVLEVGETEDGKTIYKRVAVIKPKKNAIWDNRYLAEFEDDYNAALKATEFELVSGSIPHEGVLIREID